MSIYTATFKAQAVTAAQDLFEVTAPSDKFVILRRVLLGQYTDEGDAQAEMLSLELVRGNTTAGSGGSSVTPRMLADQNGPAADTAVARNNTTEAADGTEHSLWAESFNIMAGFSWPTWAPMQPMLAAPTKALIVLNPSEIFCVRLLEAPADSITMNGTLEFEEAARIVGH